MTSTRSLSWLWLLVSLLMVLSAHADPDQTVFGPKKYTRTSGAPDVITDTFVLPGQVVAPYLLHIDNGAADGTGRLTSATVTVNGVQVVGPNDFGDKVAVIERNIAVVPTNTIEVRIAGKPPGSFMKITVLGSLAQPTPISIKPDPLSVYAGAVGNASVALAPTPRVSGTLALASDNPSVASVPGSIGFSANQASVNVPVTGIAPGNAAITASLNGGSATGTVQVTQAPPTITSMLPNTLALTQGGNSSLIITLSAAQTSDVQISLGSSDNTVASVPTKVTIPAGQSSASVQVSAIAPGTAAITANLNGSIAISQVNVTPAPPAVVSLLPAVNAATLGAHVTLNLTISSAQPVATTVNLMVSPDNIVSAPASIVVPAGQVSVPISVSTLALGTAGVTATLNGSSISAAIRVVPPAPAVVSLLPSPLKLTQDATGTLTVTLNAAQLVNIDLDITVDNPDVLRVPATITMPAGQTVASFTVTGVSVGDVTVTATVNGTSQSAVVNVAPYPPQPISLLPNTLDLQQGAIGNLTLNINAAQLTDVAIPLVNGTPDIVRVPTNAVIPMGKTTVVVPVTGLAAGFASVTASLNGATVSSSIEVTLPPPVVSELTPLQMSLPKGVPGTLRITVSRAPIVPVVVQLTSSTPAIAEVPATVTIPAGALNAEFPVFARSEGVVSVTGSLNGGVATAQITVTAPELVALTLSPQSPTAYLGETVGFIAQGTYTDGTLQDLTNQVAWTSDNATVATIGGSGAATAQAVGSSNIIAAVANVTASTTLVVQAPPALSITPSSGALKVGDTLVLSVTSAVPAGANGVLVTLTVSGAGTANVPTSVIIPTGQSTATFNLTGASIGDITLTASAPQHIMATAVYSVLPKITINSLTPSTGPVGSPVTISGSNFAIDIVGNEVRFNGERAVIASATANELKVIVPVKATSGLVTVTTALGTATSSTPFTIQGQQDFDIVLTPESIQAPLGGIAATRVKLESRGLTLYAYAAQVSVAGLPAGVTAQLERASVYAGGDTSLVISVPAGAQSGTYNLTVTATGQTETGSATHAKPLTLEILAAGATTVSGRVIHAEDDSPFVGAQIRLGTQAVLTDASGYYRFVSPDVLGDQVIKIDGHTAATATTAYPSAIAMPVMIVAGKDNVALTSYIQAVDTSKYTTIIPGAQASVTNPDIPNYSLNIPAGAVLYGWDGTPVTKVNVRTVAPDRLPIKPLPNGVTTKTVYLYYFFREGGANPTQPIPVTMANDMGALPGEKADLWYYDESTTPDANSNQWRIMGQGTVSDDGLSIVSDPGVGIPKFCCGASFASPTPPPAAPSNPPGPCSPNPVDYGTGIASCMSRHVIDIPGAFPTNLGIGYNSRTSRLGLFGLGTTFATEWQLTGAGQTLVLASPQGQRYLMGKDTDGVYRTLPGRNGAYGVEASVRSGGYNVRFPDGSLYEFTTISTVNALTAWSDPAGNRTTVTRVNFGRALGYPGTVTDPQGRVYTLAYNASRTISQISGPFGRTLTFAYDSSNRLTQVTDYAGRITQYTWGSNNLITQKTTPNGAVTQYQYDTDGRAIKETFTDGAIYNMAYLVAGGSVMETNVTDPNGNHTLYRFNGIGDLARTTDALGRISTRVLDSARNLVIAETDPAGRTTRYTYDAKGNRTSVKDALGNITQFEYDPIFNTPTQVTDPLGNFTRLQYDGKGNVSQVTTPENQTTKFTYNARGQTETVTDALGNVTRFAYDTAGNLLTITDATGRIVTRNSFDTTNRLSEAVNALGNSTNYNYDTLDRVTQVTDAVGGQTLLTYDVADNLLSVTDALGHPVQRNSFDLRGRLTQRTDAANKPQSYQYDLNGNLISSTDRNGQTTSYHYDALNRISTVNDADGRTTGYEYDLAGNISAIRDNRSGDLLLSYDILNRLTQVISDQGTVNYQYDALGRRTQRTVNGGDPVAYQYDKASRLTQLTFRGKTTRYVYDAIGRLASKTLPNGIVQTIGYDALGRVTQIQYLRPN